MTDYTVFQNKGRPGAVEISQTYPTARAARDAGEALPDGIEVTVRYPDGTVVSLHQFGIQTRGQGI